MLTWQKLLMQQVAASAGGGITFVGSSSGYSFTTAGFNLSMPAGLQAGDVVFLSIVSFYHPDYGSSGTIPLPAGYTSAVTAQVYSGKHLVAYKVMGESPDTTVACSSSRHHRLSGVAYALRGVNATVLDVPATTAVGPSYANPDAPAITPATAGAVVLAFTGGGNTLGTTLTGPPTGFVNSVLQNAYVSGVGAIQNVAMQAWGGGTVDPAAAPTSSGPVNTYSCNVSATLAIRPA